MIVFFFLRFKSYPFLNSKILEVINVTCSLLII